MYRPVKNTGDAILVPQLVFSKLTQTGSDDARFRVALYLLSSGGADAEEISRALRLGKIQTQAALSFWEGAGLIYRDNPEKAEAPPPAARKKMTTRETASAAAADPALGILLQELQRVLGRILSESDANAFAALYVQDHFPPDLILLAASYSAGKNITRAKYVEKVLMNWRGNSIDDCAKADSMLRLQAERETREKALADVMGLVWDPFTLADKKKIAQWFEEYGYGMDMIEAARLAAGDKQNDVKYLSGILKNWNSKGLRTPRDLQQGEDARNLRVTRGAKSGSDLMQQAQEYVPMKRRANS